MYLFISVFWPGKAPALNKKANVLTWHEDVPLAVVDLMLSKHLSLFAQWQRSNIYYEARDCRWCNASWQVVFCAVSKCPWTLWYLSVWPLVTQALVEAEEQGGNLRGSQKHGRSPCLLWVVSPGLSPVVITQGLLIEYLTAEFLKSAGQATLRKGSYTLEPWIPQRIRILFFIEWTRIVVHKRPNINGVLW